MLFYSSRIASTALMLSALTAGMMPASRLPATRIARAMTPVEKPIWIGTSIPSGLSPGIESATESTHTPAESPKMPAVSVSAKLSERICAMIERGEAPMARRMPISCVRS